MIFLLNFRSSTKNTTIHKLSQDISTYLTSNGQVKGAVNAPLLFDEAIIDELSKDNPLAKYCINNNGKLRLIQQDEDSQFMVCVFDDYTDFSTYIVPVCVNSNGADLIN